MSEPKTVWLDLSNPLPAGSKIMIRNLRGPWRPLNDEDDEDSEDEDDEDSEDEEVPDMIPDELPEELPGGDPTRRGMFS